MSGRCPQCGSPTEPGQACPACLLKLGISAPGAANNSLAQSHSLPELDELNRQFPQLQISGLIGRGGMGAIYHARQTSLDRDVALKIIAKEVAGDAAFLERFDREAKTLAKLSHPNVVTIFDSGHTPDGMAYLVMEYIDGMNLREALVSQGAASQSLEVSESLDLVATICRALEYAHSKGVVHRDIKPENILLADDGTLKVADFGIAKIIDESVRTPTLTATRQVLGSLHYLAPEHLEDPASVDHRVDLYAVGVILYELLTGQMPLGRYEPPSAIVPELSGEVDAVTLRALSRRPADRYQTASELAADLQRLRDSNWARPNTAAFGSEDRNNRPIAVPFNCSSMGGFGEAVGILSSSNEGIHVEYRNRDTIWGSLRSQPKVFVIPRESLSRMELRPSLFHWKLLLGAERISVLGDLPNSETGRVELRIARTDAEEARRLVHHLGFTTSSLPVYEGNSAEDVANDQKRLVFGVLLILLGIINLGGIAISETVIANSLEGVQLVVLAILCSLFALPISVLQIVTGILNLVARPRAVSLATCIACMLPVAAAWPISLPLALWALTWLRNKRTGRNPHGEPQRNVAGSLAPVGYGKNPAAKPTAEPRNVGWGATTIMFMRESRWSKLIALLNAAGLILLVGGLIAYRRGYYPTEIQFRTIGTVTLANYDEFATAQRSRLRNLSAQTEIPSSIGRDSNDTIITIHAWSKDRESVSERLKFQGHVQLVWLEPSTILDDGPVDITSDSLDTASDEAGRTDVPPTATRQLIPIRGGLENASVATLESGIGRSAMAAADPVEFESRYLKKLAINASAGLHASRKIAIYLTAEGREALAKTLPEGEQPRMLGLVLDNLLECVASEAEISSDRIEFELPANSDITVEAFEAALRGPRLLFALEKLE